MKPFTFAIASIVDANTGNGLVHRSSATDYAAHERRAHEIRSRSVIALVDSIRARLAGAFADYRSRIEQRRELRTLMQLDDHMLRDIGLDRSDLYSVKYGAVSLEELNARRLSSRQTDAADLPSVAVTAVAGAGEAVNQSAFDKRRCA